MLDQTRFGCEVHEARWNEREARWHVSTSQGAFTANFVVSAVGPLTEPALPDIDGLEEFEGEIFHTARWNHDVDLTGNASPSSAPEPRPSRSSPNWPNRGAAGRVSAHRPVGPSPFRPRLHARRTPCLRARSRLPAADTQRHVLEQGAHRFRVDPCAQNACAGAETSQAPHPARDHRYRLAPKSPLAGRSAASAC